MSQTTIPPNAPEVDVLASLDDIFQDLSSEVSQARYVQARAAILALLTREAALVGERDALAAEVGALRSAAGLALEYWQHRQQRYKNRSPAWVQATRDALARAEAGHG